MRLNAGRKGALLLAGLLLMTLASDRVRTATQPPLPNPVLIYLGPEFYQANGKQWTRYRYEVVNRAVYPSELFAAAPALPPCGQNTNSARTWVDVYEQSGTRLYGFCALGKPDDMGQLWFALETDVLPPSWIYIEMNDRQTNTKYKSNLAETTL